MIKKLHLGCDDDDMPIVTITCSKEPESNRPSDNYLKTIVIGLQEINELNNGEILNYLIERPGVKGMLTKEELLEIIDR